LLLVVELVIREGRYGVLGGFGGIIIDGVCHEAHEEAKRRMD
jgi:hypothetical protein